MEFTVAALTRRVREGLEVPGPTSPDFLSAPAPADVRGDSSVATPTPTTLRDVAAMYRRLVAVARDAGIYLATDDLVFLVAAYDSVLGREPDDPGFLEFATRLQSGSARVRVVAGLTRSPEFARRHARASMHARLPVVPMWKITRALPGHWQLFARAIGVDGARADPPVRDRSQDLISEVNHRVIELEARHWEVASLVRESTRTVLDRLDPSRAVDGVR
ncbi:MAG TPA: DUF4214 domain-containing protein [Acidimicrobiia bacterium]